MEVVVDRMANIPLPPIKWHQLNLIRSTYSTAPPSPCMCAFGDPRGGSQHGTQRTFYCTNQMEHTQKSAGCHIREMVVHQNNQNCLFNLKAGWAEREGLFFREI
ncbi:hypothetical protein AMATHDRAFT_69266, partial [Amanita thiersii Skay4041]